MLKKLCIILSSAVLFASCSTAYQQIVSMKPVDDRNITKSDDGNYLYKDGNLVFVYDFWESEGNAGFTIINNGETDVYVDLSKSYLVINSAVHDYYLDRTWRSGSTVASGFENSTTTVGTTAMATAMGLASVLIGGSYISGSSQSSGYGVSTTASSTKTSSRRVVDKNEVEYKEKPVVCIPANAARSFSEYRIKSQPYRQCGFNRYPRKGGVSVTFDARKSPLSIENRICIIENDNPRTVVMTFYGSEFNNFKESGLYKMYNANKDCIGKEPYNFNTQEAPDRFYIRYISDSYNDNGSNQSRRRRGARFNGEY